MSHFHSLVSVALCLRFTCSFHKNGIDHFWKPQIASESALNPIKVTDATAITSNFLTTDQHYLNDHLPYK